MAVAISSISFQRDGSQFLCVTPIDIVYRATVVTVFIATVSLWQRRGKIWLKGGTRI